MNAIAVPPADISFGDLLLLLLAASVLVAWFWIVFTLITDLLRDDGLSGWWKAVWVLFLVFVPFLTGLVYLIARADGMGDRATRAGAERRASDHAFGEARRALPTDELDLLRGPHQSGPLTAVELKAAKVRRPA